MTQIFRALLAERDATARDIILSALRTPEVVIDLAEDEVFVFGSNGDGAHGAGAAAAAHKSFGAVWGVGHGPTGQSYAIDTMDGEDTLHDDVADFIAYATERPETLFLLTPIGCGIAGLNPQDVAPLFKDAPSNIVLPQLFADAL